MKRKTAHKIRKWCLRVFLGLIALFFGSTVLVAFAYKFINPPLTSLMIIRCYDGTTKGFDKKITKQWVKIEDVSPHLIQAVVASEDNLFMQHNGFDKDGIKEAIKHNKKGKTMHGGSTISQQTAKNVFLWPKRSYVRKALEVYFTFLVEKIWGKKRIMEVYLNVCETGKGMYGMEVAAQKYYRKSAARLNPGEAAMLAITLPSPRKRNPASPTPYMYKRQGQILRLMNLIGPVELEKKTVPAKPKKAEPKKKEVKK